MIYVIIFLYTGNFAFMGNDDIKNHWEKVYETKQPNEVSWTQGEPITSLGLIHSFNLPKTAGIIDIGGGDSKLVDCLLEEGFENITVLDISAKALDKAKLRLGSNAAKVNWVVSDITTFETHTVFDVWHDRAAFHFLTDQKEITQYINTAMKLVKGYMIIGTFSVDGPKKCSGLEIQQYSETALTSIMANSFQKIGCITVDHTTPFSTKQNFLFCSFKRIIS